MDPQMMSVLCGLDIILAVVLFTAIVCMIVAGRQMEVNLGSSPADFLLWEKIRKISFLVFITVLAAVIITSCTIWMYLR